MNYLGTATFAQAGKERWQPSAYGLDTLIVPMRGKVDDLDDYLDSLTRWSPSEIDGNMFLSSFPNDGDKVFPTVELTYIGRKGADYAPTLRIDPPAESNQFTSYREREGDRKIELGYIGYSVSGTAVAPPGATLSLPDPILPTTPVITYARIEGSFSGNIMDYFQWFRFVTNTPEVLVPNYWYRLNQTVIWQLLGNT